MLTSLPLSTKVTIAKSAIIGFCCLHITYLVVGLFLGYLGVNPIESLTHTTGNWGVYFLLATLAITPLRRLFHWNVLMRFRRLLGLCSFFYIFLHFVIFIVFDHLLDWQTIVEDIVDRPYISLGFISFILLIALAVTSFKRLQKAMGKRWFRLHQSVYIAAILGLAHYWWLVKADLLLPFLYSVILLLLFAVRVYFFIRKITP